MNAKPVGKAKNELFEQFGIDCRPMSGFGLNALRISLPVYITKVDIDYLVEESRKKNTVEQLWKTMVGKFLNIEVNKVFCNLEK